MFARARIFFVVEAVNMPKFSREFISEVMDKNDIVDIISTYVKLKKTGGSLKGLCPFHNEKTPSFSVSPDKQLFYCFGCGVGGNVLDFVIKRENLDFVEAVTSLAERARIELPKDNYGGGDYSKSAQDAAYEKKQLYYKINSDAGRYFYDTLMSPAGQAAQQYLISRKLDNSTINKFGIGFAKEEWNALLIYLRGKGYKDIDIESAGLSVKRDNGEYYDRFRGRIMFPIIDVRGNVIGFGGRAMGDMQPKYLNSPETVIFNKSRNLFALNLAKNSKDSQMLIMEGYMDVVAVHQNGVLNAVASLGTALTSEQAKMLGRYSKEVIICYDSDNAGVSATERAIEVLREANVKTKILQIEGAKDPDELINLRGVEFFKNLVVNAKSALEYKISRLSAQYNVSNIDDKIEFTQKIAEIFAKVENAVEREAYLAKISVDVEISIEAIMAEIRRLKFKDERAEEARAIAIAARVSESNTGERVTRKNKGVITAEKLLLNLMCEKSIFNIAANKITADDFSISLHKQIALYIYDTYKNERRLDVHEVVSYFEGNPGVIEILLDDKNVEDKEKASIEAINTIQEDVFQRKKAELLAKGNEAELLKLINQKKKGGVE